MSRAGRPRNTPITLAGAQLASGKHAALAGVRYPSGKLRPARLQPEGTPQAKIKRAVDLALNGAADPIFATSIGWLRLHGKLTDTQTAAAVQYAKIRGMSDRVLGLPRRTAASPSYDEGFGGLVIFNSDHAERTCKRYSDLRSEIKRGRPYMQATRMVSVLDTVCIEGLSPATWELDLLRTGLDIVAGEFGLTKPNRK